MGGLTDVASAPQGKWIVIALWLVATAVFVPLAPTLEEVTKNEQAAFLPEGAESTEVVELVQERFPSDGTPAVIVFHNDAGLSDADVGAARQLNDWLLREAPQNVDRSGVVSIFTSPGAESSLRSADGTTMTLIANITGEAAEQPFMDTIDAIRDKADELEGAGSDGFEIRTSGPGGLLKDLIEVFMSIDGFLLMVTAILVLVLPVAIYRSPVAAVVPLVSVGWVFALASAIGALAARELGLPVNGQSSGIMTVLLFGAGTDYCLFVSARYREELAHTEDKHEAMRKAMRAVGEAIASSAGTVLVATLALLVAILRSNQALGPLLAIAIGTMLVAALTLVPALVTVLGRWAFWPFRPRYVAATADVDDEAHGIWGWIAERVARAPAVVLATSVGLFLLLALGGLRIEQTFDSITSLPAGTESREGFEILRESFPAGELSPTELYVVLPDGAAAFDRLDAIGQLTTALAATDGVASVASLSHPFGLSAAQARGETGVPQGPGAAEVAAALSAIPAETRQGIDAGEAPPPGAAESGDPVLGQQIGLYSSARRLLSADGGVVQLNVVLEENPYSLSAIESVPGLRETARATALETGLTDLADWVLLGGETATAYDTKEANDRDIRVVFPVILVAIGVILALLLRSLVAPIYLLLTIVLSYFATLGLSTVVFQDILGQDGTGPGVPFFLFVFLVALGVDYNIFLMARVREETSRHGLLAGTRRALGRTGGVITSAGIILAGTFAALMTLPLQELFQTGFAVAVGVLLDTFIVRTLMVPAIVLLLGRWNWWPGSVRTVEGERVTAVSPVTTGH